MKSYYKIYTSLIKLTCGPNSIPTNNLKNNIINLSEPIEIVLKMSLFEGVFPKLTKLANVRPSYKKSEFERVH